MWCNYLKTSDQHVPWQAYHGWWSDAMWWHWRLTRCTELEVTSHIQTLCHILKGSYERFLYFVANHIFLGFFPLPYRQPLLSIHSAEAWTCLSEVICLLSLLSKLCYHCSHKARSLGIWPCCRCTYRWWCKFDKNKSRLNGLHVKSLQVDFYYFFYSVWKWRGINGCLEGADVKLHSEIWNIRMILRALL